MGVYKTGKGINEGLEYICNEIYERQFIEIKDNNEIMINNNDKI